MKKSAAAAGMMASGSLLTGMSSNVKTHLFSLSFDDGFARSFIKTAEIYEKYGLQACFNVIASGGTPGFKGVDEYIVPNTIGDFSLWNELKQRGHEIMPHGYKHANLTEIPLKEVKDLFNRCMDIFGEKLDGFKPEEAVFNFPFNASIPAVEDWIGRHVMAYRTAGELVNPRPEKNRKRLTCISQGPENIDEFITAKVNEFLDSDGGWFIFNTHGLDGEGWGPMSSGLLDEILSRLSGMDKVAILPVGMAFRQYGS